MQRGVCPVCRGADSGGPRCYCWGGRPNPKKVGQEDVEQAPPSPEAAFVSTDRCIPHALPALSGPSRTSAAFANAQDVKSRLAWQEHNAYPLRRLAALAHWAEDIAEQADPGELRNYALAHLRGLLPRALHTYETWALRAFRHAVSGASGGPPGDDGNWDKNPFLPKDPRLAGAVRATPKGKPSAKKKVAAAPRRGKAPPALPASPRAGQKREPPVTFEEEDWGEPEVAPAVPFQTGGKAPAPLPLPLLVYVAPVSTVTVTVPFPGLPLPAADWVPGPHGLRPPEPPKFALVPLPPGPAPGASAGPAMPPPPAPGRPDLDALAEQFAEGLRLGDADPAGAGADQLRRLCEYRGEIGGSPQRRCLNYQAHWCSERGLPLCASHYDMGRRKGLYAELGDRPPRPKAAPKAPPKAKSTRNTFFPQRRQPPGGEGGGASSGPA